MNDKVSKPLEEAAARSLGNMRIVSYSDRTLIHGTDVGETVDLVVTGKPAKLVLVGLPTNADAAMAFDAVNKVAPVLALAADAGVDTRALAWAQRFAKGTTEDLAKSGISTIEAATGATILLAGSYTFVSEGSHRNYPEAGAIEELMTKRGEDLIRSLLAITEKRITTQSLAAAATKIAADAGRKPVSTSVVARFVGKLNDLELVAPGGKRGFVITQDGRQRLEAAFPDLSPRGTQVDPTPPDRNPVPPASDDRTRYEHPEGPELPPDDDDDYGVQPFPDNG